MALKPMGLLALAALVVAAFAVSVGTLLAAPQPQAAKPTAEIKIVAVPANAANSDAIMATLPDGKTKVATGTTGLSNVSVGVPVALQAVTADPKEAGLKIAWTLTAPTASKAALKPNNEPLVKFTPDVSGTYKVDLVISNAAGASPMASVQIRAGEYIGVLAGNCVQCHEGVVKEWEETGHGTIFEEEINGGADPATSHYGEGCVRCHTTGYNPGVKNGGFADVQAQTGWAFPALADIQKGKGQWESMPAALRNMGNIQCEDCHGPAKDHVEKGAKMPTSLDNGVCNVCHAGGGHHIKGMQILFAGHSDATAETWTNPTGPSRQACVRCHTGSGYVSFIENPTEMASWDNRAQTVGCATCHEPHSDANKFQLRIVGKPVETANLTRDFGLSATCVECHAARTKASEAVNFATPHYSVAGEMLSDTGGVTYGQTLPNSPHGLMVGSAPMKDQAGEALFGGAVPGSCVACHMYPSTLDAKDPNFMKVGEHSFNTASPDGSFEFTAPCQSCHAGMTSFNLKAKADYDGNGQVEGVQEEVAGLMHVLVNALADTGVKAQKEHPYFDQSNRAAWSDKQRNAVYNYLFVRGPEGNDGKTNAIHNFKRTAALLQASYRDLTGRDVPNATMLTTAAPAPAPAAPAPAAAAPAPAPAAPAQPAAAAPAGGIPSTPHAIQGREQCTMCHTVGGPGAGAAGGTGVSASHQGRTDATCVACHK